MSLSLSRQQQPPSNFALVSPGVYRSGFPSKHNLPFLASLGLRAIVRITPAEYPPETAAWIGAAGDVFAITARAGTL